MKYATHLTLIAIGLAALSCGNSTAAKTDSSSAVPREAAAAASAASNFSFSMNGKPIRGEGVDEMQLRNTAFLYADKEKGDQILMELASTKTGDDPKPDYFIRIKLPARPGTYSRKGEESFDSKTMPSFMLDFLSGDLSRYTVMTNHEGDIATVTITSNDGKRVTGTFTATLSLSNDTPRGTVKIVAITDGKFDVPYSTGKLYPE